MDSSTLDGIVFTKVYEHPKDPDKVLSEISRTLKVGGKLVFSIPFMFFIHGSPNDYRRLTLQGINMELSKHNLQVEKFISNESLPLLLLNQIVCRYGFTKSYLQRVYSLPIIFIVNLLSIFLNRNFKILNSDMIYSYDRVQTMGFVVLAKKI